MSRYDLPRGPEGEFEPGSGGRVLRNLAGITNSAIAEERETELLAIAYVDSFDWVTSELRFRAEIIREMHRLWLGSLYPMAGQYRTVNLSKGGFPFCSAEFIDREMNRFASDQLTKHTPCHAVSIEDAALKAASVHAELLLIHPFREGNGRLGRWLADLMILQAGFAAPDYDLAEDRKRNQYLAAMRKGYAGEISDLAALFAYWIQRAQ